MQAFHLPHTGSVLCLGAHSDDIEIGCGATLLQLFESRPDLHVHWCVFSGDAVRQQEAQASAERWLQNVASPTIQLFEFRDSFFPDQWTSIKEKLAAIAQEITPDVVFTHHLEDRHQDHRVLAELTWCAFRNHLVLEYEIPKFEGDLGKPNLHAPVSRQQCEDKIHWLSEYFPSQSDKGWFDPELFRSLMRIRGSECNAQSRYAEAFHCRKATLQFPPTS